MQFDQGEKGFSFSKEGPLDMRMDPTSDLTAREIVNTWPEKELGHIFKEYGEDPRWQRAAKAIVEGRKKNKISTTRQLAQLIEDALKTKTRGRLHPATLVFQALRIVVNRELEVLSDALVKAIRFLSSGGKIGVLSFHSLEDRIVKNIFRTASMTNKKQEKAGVFPALKLLTKKPIATTLAEIRANPRASSAKLRFAQRT